jgi:hypothetical protein
LSRTPLHDNIMATLSIPNASDLVAYDHWLSELPISPATGWRWRKRGWILTINIAGRVYVSRRDIAEFERRAAAGEFAKQHVTPKRSRTR